MTFQRLPGYNGRYEVSDCGVVRCVSTGKEVAQRTDKWGYRTVRLSLGCRGTQKHEFVHRLVLLAFKGPPPPGKEQARHLNDVQSDNYLSNLAWGDQRDNAEDRAANGNAPAGANNPNAKLSAEAVNYIREHEEEDAASVAARFGVTPATVYFVRQGKTWRAS